MSGGVNQPETSREPPTWFVVAALAAGGLLIGGAVVGAVLVWRLESANPAGTHAWRPPSTRPPATPQVAATAKECGPCEFSGSECRAGLCRLASDAQWLVRPTAFATSRSEADDIATSNCRLCVRHPGDADWVCSEGAARRSGSMFYFGPSEHLLSITSQELEQQGLEVALWNRGRLILPATKVRHTFLKPSKRLFDGGILFPVKRGLATKVIVGLAPAGSD